jgi:hypothetical protein
MLNFTIEKCNLTLPAKRKPNMMYLLKDIYGRLSVHATNTNGDITITSQQELFTTPKIEIINNKILLPRRPDGDIVLGVMLVYGEDNEVTEYDGVTVSHDTFICHAELNEDHVVTGSGVVTYLTRCIST